MGVTIADAKDLGLSDGQVVQATVEVRDNRVTLILKGFAVDAPTFKIDAPTFKIDAPDWNEREAKNGDTVQLKASLTTSGWILTPTASKQNAGPTQSSFPAASPTSSSNQSTLTPAQNTGSIQNGATNVTTRASSVGINANLGTPSSVVGSGTNVPPGVSAGASVNPLANAQDIPESANALSPKSFAALENQNLNSYGALNPSVIPNWSTRLNTLMFEPSQLSAVFELLMPGALSSLVSQPQLQNWIQRWNANRLSMASLNPAALKNVVLSQSKTIERQLLGMSQSVGGSLNKALVNNASAEPISSSGQGGFAMGFDQDPKTMLKSLSALLDKMQPTPETTKLSHQVKIATNELESSQVQTAQQLMRGDLAFHAVIPFWDADPVDLYFKKSKNGHDDASDHTLTVDIHSKSRVLGEVWLNTSISKSTQVDLVMWAVRPEVAELARTNATELGYELGVSGLSLNSFQIFNAPKPIEEPLPRPHAGAGLDTRV